MYKKKSNSEILFLDLPQRVIVHKILIYHLFSLYEDEEDPYLLFGYFKYDRLRNIWFVFSSVCCRYGKGYEGNVNILNNVIINYSKLSFIYFAHVTLPKNLAELSPRMYSLRSIVCFSTSLRSEIFPESFFSNSKFPNLKLFSLSTNENPTTICNNWKDFEFFDQLETLELKFNPKNGFDFSSFFRTKEMFFSKNLKIIRLGNICFKKKMILHLPNLIDLKITRCENLSIIPSEKKLKKIFVSSFEDSGDEFKQITKNSKNAISLYVMGGFKVFFGFFDKEDFPNLEILGVSMIGTTYNISKKWNFCFRLKVISIALTKDNSDFFQKNDWNQLEKLRIIGCETFQMKGVKFPSLLSFVHHKNNIRFGNLVTDEFFCFEGKRLEELDLSGEYFRGLPLTGKGWNKDIFRTLRVLRFRNQFNDSFFQEHEFPNLRKLVLCGNSTLRDRKSWREMKSLEEIKIDGIRPGFISSWKRN